MSQLPIGSKFGTFMLVRHIGGGGMAQIYLAKIHGLAGFEKYLALKVINSEYATEDRFIQMLIDEAKITVGLSHINIGQIFDLGQVDGTYYIAMEFVDGIDILELVNGLYVQSEKVPLEAVAYIGRQMCSGLHYAHTRKDKQGKPLNLIHRDISPQNILVSRAGEVKVVDFGIAKAAGMTSKTQAGVIKGKVHYMAPEQAMGKTIDHRIDIFSTGIVLWEMLTSQMVYSGDNVRDLLEKVRRANIPPPSRFRSEVPEALDAIVMKALARNVEERFQNAHELMVALTKFLSSCAPDYSGSHLATLVERIVSAKELPKENVREVLSKNDVLPNVHSVISQSLSGMEEPTDLKNVPRLEVTLDGERSLFQLNEELIVGRAGNLTVADARVSRRHARFFRQQQIYYVEDLGSSNGTYVNDQRILETHELQQNDVVRVGSCQMRYIPGAKSTKKSSPPPAPLASAELQQEPRPRLMISQGAQRWEQPLPASAHEFSYTLQLGALQLTGRWARLSRRQDSLWLEPLGGRLPVLRRGKATAEPFQLQSGDVFEFGGCSFQYLE